MINLFRRKKPLNFEQQIKESERLQEESDVTIQRNKQVNDECDLKLISWDKTRGRIPRVKHS